jgi:hypothetical protein
MCGACGAGRSGPRWEDTLGGPTRAALQARAAAANRLLGADARLRVRAWFAVGYLVADRVGRSTHVTELDSLWQTARGWGATLPGWESGGGDPVTVHLDLPARSDPADVAVWLAAVAHLARPDALEVRLPDPDRDRTVVARVAPGAVDLTVVPGAATGRMTPGSVTGAGAAEAARHLYQHLAGASSGVPASSEASA